MMAQDSYLLNKPEIRRITEALRSLFKVTWCREQRIKNADLIVLLLKPSRDISETFGIEREVAFFYSPFANLQGRTMQAIEAALDGPELKGRVDRSVAFLNAPARDIGSWVKRYLSEHPETVTVIPFADRDLEEALDKKWLVKNAIKSSFFVRNLFDYRLPLKSDKYFYGRDDIVASLIDAIKKSQNSGLFGLRKTGKTSVLLKVSRSLERSDVAYPIFFDCKRRSVQKSDAEDLCSKLLSEVEKYSGKKYQKRLAAGDDIFDVLQLAIEEAPRNKKIVFIFDEIEYISPLSPTRPHWASDFVEFWQSMWAIQTETDKVSFLICGVNPTVCERDRFPSEAVEGRTVQNPMFSIFQPYFLSGLDLESLEKMVSHFGARMGLRFGPSSIEYLHHQYGGHPLLTRLACSYHHEVLLKANIDRPIELTAEGLRSSEEERDLELGAYCEHVVSELRELYPDEYQMLEMLAQGEVADYKSLAEGGELVRNITNYGLVAEPSEGLPEFSIPVVKRYLNRNLHATASHISGLTAEDRQAWLSRRMRSLVGDLPALAEELKAAGGFQLYKGNIKGLHTLLDLEVVEDKLSAISFLSEIHKIIVEPSDKWLKGATTNIEFDENAPSLRTAFLRLKTYRNYYQHDDIRGQLLENWEKFKAIDFFGKDPNEIDDGWYILQRRVVDNLHVALQVELGKY